MKENNNTFNPNITENNESVAKEDMLSLTEAASTQTVNETSQPEQETIPAVNSTESSDNNETPQEVNVVDEPKPSEETPKQEVPTADPTATAAQPSENTSPNSETAFEYAPEALQSFCHKMNALMPSLFKQYIIKANIMQALKDNLDEVVREETSLRMEHDRLKKNLDQITAEQDEERQANENLQRKYAAALSRIQTLEEENDRILSQYQALADTQRLMNNDLLSSMENAVASRNDLIQHELNCFEATLKQLAQDFHQMNGKMLDSMASDAPDIGNATVCEKLDLIIDYITKEKTKLEASKAKVDADRKAMKKERAEFESEIERIRGEMDAKKEALDREISEFEANRESASKTDTPIRDDETTAQLEERLAFYEELLAGIRQVRGYGDVMAFERNLNKFQQAYNDMSTIVSYCGKAKDKELATSLKDIIHEIKRTASAYVDS